MTTRDCLHHGHVWLEADGQPYERHRGSGNDTVSVTCQHCPASGTLPRFAAYSGRRPKGMPVDTKIPAPFQKVLDRAIAEESKL